jgi:hypothetical protein
MRGKLAPQRSVALKSNVRARRTGAAAEEGGGLRDMDFLSP